jgi:predicted ester cyclase
MSTPTLVAAFYEEIWNRGNADASRELLTEAFAFRGSLGTEEHGRDKFIAYVEAVRSSLADYRCEILECVSEGNQAFAQMRFAGRHVGVFRGYTPTGKPVEWLGAALFRFAGPRIARLWVLGDLASLDALLQANQEA